MKSFDISALAILLSLAVLSLPSCGPEPKEVAEVSCDVAFRIDGVGDWTCAPPLVSGDRLYLFNWAQKPTEAMAVDLPSGEVLWRKCPYEGLYGEGKVPFLCMEFLEFGGALWSLYYVDSMSYFIEIDPDTGDCLKIVRAMLGGEQDSIGGFSMAGYGTGLFYFNKSGIARLDLASLAPIETETRLFEAPSSQVHSFGREKVTGHLIEAVGNALVASYRHQEDYADAGILRFDMDSLEKKWEVTGIASYDAFSVMGDTVYSPVLAFDDGTEASASWRFRAYSLDDGELIGDFDSGTQAECRPILGRDGVIQASSVNSAESNIGKPRLFCLDPDTLALKWRVDFTEQYEWSGSNCQERNGIVYQPHGSGVRLYDSATGSLLGYDNALHASGGFNTTESLAYRDTMIVFDGYEGRLLGIRMNFKKSVDGVTKE